MDDRAERPTLRNPLYRSLIVAVFGIIMISLEGYRILGLINLGAALLIFVTQYLMPLRRQRTVRSDGSDTNQ